MGIDQLPGIGCTAQHWWRARRSGRWDLLTRRVLVLAGCPDTDDQRVHATLLDTGGGAALHAVSTLAWIGLRQFNLSQIHVVRRRETTSDRGELGILHRLRDLDARDIVVIRGVPTVRPIRAIWAYASQFSAPRDFDIGYRKVGRVLDDAHVLGAVTWEELHASVERLGRPGRAGTTLMRALLPARPVGSSPTESRNEDRFEEVIGERRSSYLLRQRWLGGEAPIGRSDYRGDGLPMVIEVNSIAFHSTPSDQAADEKRYAEFAEAGFTVGVVWDDDLWREPTAVVQLVDTVRRHAGRGDPAVFHTASCPWPYDPTRRFIGRAPRPFRG